MRLSDLIASLQSSSHQWFDVIVSEFGGVHNFLLRYPHEFSLSRYCNDVSVTLASHSFYQPRNSHLQQPSSLYTK